MNLKYILLTLLLVSAVPTYADRLPVTNEVQTYLSNNNKRPADKCTSLVINRNTVNP